MQNNLTLYCKCILSLPTFLLKHLFLSLWHYILSHYILFKVSIIKIKWVDEIFVHKKETYLNVQI